MEAVVDDFVAFWEISCLAKRSGAGRTDSDSRAAAATAMKDLWRDELIAFYRGRHFTGDERELTAEEIDKELSDSDNWDWVKPRGEGFIQIAATGKGRVLYLAGGA